MKRKTKALADRFVAALSSWTTVECVALNEAALSDTLDPYFALILDVYYRGAIPSLAERQALYGDDAAAFETSTLQHKDRFLIGDLPVRIEFKSVKKVDDLVTVADSRIDQLWLLKDSGTYMFYRLSRGEILFRRGDWIDQVRSRLSSLSEEFWERLRASYQSKMEHSLNDLGAALIQGDDFYYLVSSALFIKSACVVLFCVNRRFEPSHRAFYSQVKDLEILPDAFIGRFESFLRNDSEMTPERKYAVAQLIARSIIVI